MNKFLLIILLIILSCNCPDVVKKNIGELTWKPGGEYTDLYLVEIDSLGIIDTLDYVKAYPVGTIAKSSYIFRTKNDGKLLLVGMRSITNTDTSGWVVATLKKE